MKRSLPTVLLSVETVSRELSSKLVLGAALAGAGFRAIVGHKEVIQETARRSRRVVWLGKSVFVPGVTDASLASELAQNGSVVMWHHDEGGIYPERYWDACFLRSHPPRHLSGSQAARICLWGERQKSLLAERAPHLAPALTATGSARFDLCRPAFDWTDASVASDARERLAPYILVNTRFPTVMHAKGPDYGFHSNDADRDWPEEMTPQAIRDQWFATWNQDGRDFAAFVVLIKEMATAFPAFNLVLRPHPSENVDFYRQAFAPFGNVHVVREQSVMYWIRNARLVVHCKCTTGVEAALAERPVLQYWPERVRDTGLGETIAREAGVTAVTLQDALDRASALLGGAVPAQQWSPEAEAMLSNLTRPAIPTLVDEVKRVIEATGIGASTVVLPAEDRGALAALRERFSPEPVSYVASKRGPFDLGEVERIIDGCARQGVGRAKLAAASRRHVVIEPPDPAT